MSFHKRDAQMPSSQRRRESADGRPERRAGPGRLSEGRWLAAVLAVAVLAGCSGSRKPAYPESFKETDTYSRSFPASDAATCEAARRALLSQGYTIDKARTDSVDGQKNFQDEDDKHQVISFHIVCASDGQEAPTTTVFVNAVQDRYTVKKVSSSAGVGLTVLGSVSMPFGSSDDSLAKISSQTIADSAFYAGFFDLLQRYLPKSAEAAREGKTPAQQAKADGKSPAAGAAPEKPGAGPAQSGAAPAAEAATGASPGSGANAGGGANAGSGANPGSGASPGTGANPSTGTGAAAPAAESTAPAPDAPAAAAPDGGTNNPPAQDSPGAVPVSQ
ncbi:DUF2242 domain-containing protein [Bordetella genomosp. 9]|uniref:DUF2242 domain-containing protein n=1 Tax=Bordetella genomosp. 9 TaxID=1416803 RepID=UPI0022B75666|nr:DUF2242 domain-containing protein [Bordetella genomosp. 9]